MARTKKEFYYGHTCVNCSNLNEVRDTKGNIKEFRCYLGAENKLIKNPLTESCRSLFVIRLKNQFTFDLKKGRQFNA